MSTIGSSSASEASSSLAATRGRAIRRVLSSEEEPNRGDAKRRCTNESRAGSNNNNGNDLSSPVRRREDVVEEGAGEERVFNERRLEDEQEDVFPSNSRVNCDNRPVGSNTSRFNRSHAIGNNDLGDDPGVFDDLGDMNNDERIPENTRADIVSNKSNASNKDQSSNNPTSNNTNRNSSRSNKISEKQINSSSTSNKSHFNEKFTSIENILFGEGNASNSASSSKRNGNAKQPNESLGNINSRVDERNKDERGQRSISYGTENNFDMEDNLRSRLEPDGKQNTTNNENNFRKQNGSVDNLVRSEVYSDYNQSIQNGHQSNAQNASIHKESRLKHPSNKTNNNYVNSTSSTRSENTDRIESFDGAILNDFQPVEDVEMDNELVSQDTTVMNVCTPLNPEKLRIVFKHCLEGEGSVENEVERGRVLVYSSDDENS